MLLRINEIIYGVLIRIILEILLPFKIIINGAISADRSGDYTPIKSNSLRSLKSEYFGEFAPIKKIINGAISAPVLVSLVLNS